MDSPQFFINRSTPLPPPDTDEYLNLIKEEENKILGGITIDGVYISGWLYWHLNHWWIRIDSEDEFGNDIRIERHPELRDNEWIRAEHLEKCRIERKGYVEVGARQGGKELINSSLLYTPTGEITIGECKIGDEIYDESGKLTTIIGKHPQGVKPLYKYTFIDGREVVCGLEHKWFVYDRFTNKNVVKNTKQLLEDYKRIRPSWINRKNPYEYRYSIYNNSAVEYSKKELPIHPYLLGLWLGDGSNTYSKITSVDKEVIDWIYKYASSVDLKVTKDGEFTYMITSGKAGGDLKSNINKNFIHTYLKNNLYNNKHIPDAYMYSSIEDRMELLRGLMDSDGSCDMTGSIEFSSSNEKLALDFYKLCRGLGIVLTKKNQKSSYKKNNERINCKKRWRFTLFTDLPVFKLSRKLNNIKCKSKYQERVAIVGIEYLKDDYATCITVDNDSHLFLTDNYTPTHNSEFEASFFGMNAVMFQNTQNVIVCGNDNDLSLLKDKVDFGLRKLWDGINIPRLDKTWRSNQVKLGYKTPDGDDQIWSYIVIRNAKDGHNTEVAAGTTAKSFIMDEIGKYSFSSAFKAAEPAFKGKNGWRAIPILVGTGGAFENGKDAENFFYNPESNNFLSVENEDGSKSGLFLSGVYRQDCKYKTTLGHYIEATREIKLPKNSELFSIPMYISDKEKAIEVIQKERESAKLHPDRTLYLKQVMYYPITVDECFLSAGQNIFDIEAAKRQKARLINQERTGVPVILYNDEGSVKHEFTDKMPISNFPLKNHDSKDAPVVVYEFPIESPPYGLYVAGVDPYRQGKSEYSSSLGSVYVYKRMHAITGEKYQDMFVASYTARPDKKETWEEQARLLIKFYNARTLCENDEISFIDYMISKGDAHYLERQPDWLKEIVPNTTVRRDYGIHRSADKIRSFLHGCLKKYTEEVVAIEKNEQGEVTSEVKGMVKILDPVLLEEIIQYNEEGNFDRIIAAELAIALAMKLDPIMGKIGADKDERIQAMFHPKQKNRLFTESRGLFKSRKHKIFT